ncbi:MAG: cytochrome c biogenesis protein transmembrane region [Microgenomates group bacterium GW2011_GWC1_44_9]|nr:MAG: cytochrome c biogenesis protein transmembrane region [Microgenomates group bacterium GW2011_GWC1_44_9]
MTVNLPILTATALANGLNPCGIGMMITFLGYLLVFGGKDKDKKWIYKVGFSYILSVFVTYLIFGLFFYGAAFYFQRSWLAGIFKYIIGGAITIAGLIQLKDVFWQDLPIHLRMPKVGFEKLNKLMSRTSIGVAAVIGFLTTVFSTPCMLPLYIGTTAVIARSGLPMAQVLGLFFYYNLVFISPLVLILLVMGKGRQVVDMKEWEHKNTKWMRLVLGIALVIVGIVIAVR